MSDYRQRSGHSASQLAILVVVIALHVIALYVFVKATSFNYVTSSVSVLQTKLIPPDPPKPEDPLPLPASLANPPNVVIQPIPPEIPIETSKASTAIQLPKEDVVENNVTPTTAELIGPIVPPIKISGPHSNDRYPGSSVKNKESGRTELKICIAVAGVVDSAEVTKSSGYPALDKAAVNMALDTRFKPATRMGIPVAYCMVTGIRFRLH